MPGRWLSLYVMCTGMLMIVLDTTVVNVALPSMQHDLGFTQAGLAWIINAYLVAFAGFLLISGRMGDIFGCKRVFLAGLSIFVVASLLCGLAPNAPFIVIARFVQGIGGAMTSAVILAMIVMAFPEERERTRAMGVFSFTASAGGSVGLLLGGPITQGFGWHWVFFLNVPIGLAVLLFGARSIHAPEGLGLREGADVIGAVTITASLMAAIYGVLQIPAEGLSRDVMLTLAIAALFFAIFIWRQLAASQPLIPLRLFATRNLTVSNVANVLAAAAMFAFFFLDTLRMQRSGYTPAQTGFAFLPFCITIGALSLGFAERLSTRFGAKRVFVAGLLLATFGMIWLTAASRSTNYLLAQFVPMIAMAVGLGCAFPPLMIFAMWDTDAEDAGAASGIVQTTSEGGGALGLAAISSIAAVGGFTAAFACATVLIALATVLAQWGIRAERPVSAS
jgi:EmrB/QacA subfamily drug resistance transporter